MSERYEYLVTYRSRESAIWRRRGRVIKQTETAAKKLASWAKTNNCDVRIQKRSVGEWEQA